MMRFFQSRIFKGLIWILLQAAAFAANPYSGSPPFKFSIPEAILWDQLIVVSPLLSDSLRFVWRSATKVYAYDHNGNKMWDAAVSNPNSDDFDRGYKIGVADVDGDTLLEVVVVTGDNKILVLNALTGSQERSITVTVGLKQKVTYMALANFEGKGMRQVVVQTRHHPVNTSSYARYVNRSLIAFDLEDGTQLWRQDQDTTATDPLTNFYEGYWPQAHGGPMIADMDGDGLDEVMMGNMIDNNGTAIDLGYNKRWLGKTVDFMDHIDCIAIGDYRTDLKGLEAVMSQEDHADGYIGDPDLWQYAWETVMLRYDPVDPGKGRLFKRKIHERWTVAGSKEDYREPQNVSVGNFSSSYSGYEIWNASRFAGSDAHKPISTTVYGQYPWVYNKDTALVAEYSTAAVLPSGFNTHANGNAQGLEPVYNIDWTGGTLDYVGARARHSGSNIGVFNAMTGASVWNTIGTGKVEYAVFINVADVGGDSREEFVIYDNENSGTSHSIEVYWNTDSFTDTQPNKWDDPLYVRLKQNYNLYSPGSYTRRAPVQADLKIMLEGAYDPNTGLMNTTLQSYGMIPLQSPYGEDPRIVASIPANVVDWILVELRMTATGHTVQYRSAFLRNDGQIIDEKGNTKLNLFVEKANPYFIAIRHRNHLAAMSRTARPFSTGTVTYNFTTSSSQFYGTNGVKELATGIWGLYAGDGNKSGVISIADRNVAYLYRDQVGYLDGDHNLSGIVTMKDVTIALVNRDKVCAVPNN